MAPLFQYYVESTQPVPNIKVQTSSITANSIMMNYQITGAYMQVYETCHQDVMITITIDVILIPLKRNGTVPYVFV